MSAMTNGDEAIAVASALLGMPLRLVRALPGGSHASTLLVRGGGSEYVVRQFPEYDAAPAHEVDVLRRLSDLDDLVPHLIAHDVGRDRPVLVTSTLDGSTPAPDLSPTTIATEMSRALARIHSCDGSGLPLAPDRPRPGHSPIARRAAQEWEDLDLGERVLTHGDFWCGNALWTGARLTGVVDWSGARCAPRGVDVAWCRQDLVLLGSVEAADLFVEEYEAGIGRRLSDIRAWDVQAAAYAEPRVHTWAVNYRGIGRPEITGHVLRERLSDFAATL